MWYVCCGRARGALSVIGVALVATSCQLKLLGSLDGDSGTTPTTIIVSGPPTVSLASTPGVTAYTDSAQFTFAGTQPDGLAISGYECALDGAAFSSCPNPYVLSDLTTGSHTLAVRSVDVQGNRSDPESHTWQAYAWKSMDRMTALGPGNTRVVDLKKDASGNLYEVATTLRGSTPTTVIRRSTDGGATWANWQVVSKSFASIAFAPGGAIYGLGLVGTGFISNWGIWKSADSGASWTKVDEYALNPSFAMGTVGAIAVDSAGRVFAVGSSTGADFKKHWIVRRSTDSGATWTTVHDYQYVAGQDSASTGIAIDASDRLYVIGNGSVTSISDARWIVQRSTDGGATWGVSDTFFDTSYTNAISISVGPTGKVYAAGFSQTLFFTVRMSSDSGASWASLGAPFQYAGGSQSRAFHVAEDGSGILYAVGEGGTAAGSHWVVRKSIDGGANWTTVRDFAFGPVGPDSATRALVTTSGHLVVAGTISDGASTHAYVERTADDGATWPSIDDFRDTFNQHFVAKGLARTSSGVLYAAGSGGGQSAWIVRKSTDGGTSWTTVDSWSPSATGSASANAIGVTPSGAIFAVGQRVPIFNSDEYWVVRRSTDGGATWSTVDDFQLTTGSTFNYHQAFGFGVDAVGNIYAVGEGTAAGQSSRWVVRRSTDGGTTWATVDTHTNGGSWSAMPRSFSRDSAGNLYVAGTAPDAAAGGDRLEVRKSIDNGATWATVDSYKPFAWWHGRAMTVDPSDHLYVIGDSANQSCHIRKSTTGGASWTTLNLQVGGNCYPVSITSDLAGRIYVFYIHYTAAGTPPYRKYVKVSADGGATWTTIDDPMSEEVTLSFQGDLLAHPGGGIYLMGSAPDTDGVHNWLVKRFIF
jgi:hypothetical protein